MKPDLSGVWRLVAEKSKLLGPAPAGDIVIEHREPQFSSTMTARTPGGEEVRLVFHGNTSGEEFENTLGGTVWRSRATWEGGELRIESWIELSGRKAHFCDFWSLADGGQTLIMEHRGDDLAGQRSVLQRVVAPSVGNR